MCSSRSDRRSIAATVEPVLRSVAVNVPLAPRPLAETDTRVDASLLSACMSVSAR